jgi:hypothetical protein
MCGCFRQREANLPMSRAKSLLKGVTLHPCAEVHGYFTRAAQQAPPVSQEELKDARCQALYDACLAGDLPTVKQCLQEKWPLNVQFKVCWRN